MDYRYRLCSTNCHHAQLEDNGELILVVSHQDLGYPNWLDPSGHEEGYITVRWVGAEHYPTPECVQMKSTELAGYLPDTIKTLSVAERSRQLAGRRSGILKRFSG
jgi:hypothetical protein